MKNLPTRWQGVSVLVHCQVSTLFTKEITELLTGGELLLSTGGVLIKEIADLFTQEVSAILFAELRPFLTYKSLICGQFVSKISIIQQAPLRADSINGPPTN